MSKERHHGLDGLSITVHTCGLPGHREIASKGPWEPESCGFNWRTVFNHWPIINELSQNSLTKEALTDALKEKFNLPIDSKTVASELEVLEKSGICGKEFIGADEILYLTPQALKDIQSFSQIP